MRIAAQVMITAEQRTQLEAWANGRRVPVRVAQRAKIVLLAVDGKTNIQIAAELGIGRLNAARWRERFVELGTAGIERDAPRPGRTRRIPEHKVKKIVQMTTQERPLTRRTGYTPDGAANAARQACGASGMLISRRSAAGTIVFGIDPERPLALRYIRACPGLDPGANG